LFGRPGTLVLLKHLRFLGCCYGGRMERNSLFHRDFFAFGNKVASGIWLKALRQAVIYCRPVSGQTRQYSA
jgi:hypothetical protein